MAKKLESIITNVTGITETQLGTPVELPNVAFSIIYNGKKKYSVVAIKFAAGSTNSAGQVEVIESNLDIYDAHHVFKTTTVNAGLFKIGVDKV